MLPGFTVPSSLGKPKHNYATASMSGAAQFSLYTSSLSYFTAPGLNWGVALSAVAPAAPVCPSGTFCCEYDAESHKCIGGCCPSPTSCCPDGKPGTGNRCTNLNADPANCGRCNNACPAGERCSNGFCCPAGLTHCGNTCVDLTRDPANCGYCGHSCSGGICSGGQCVNCPPGFGLCGGTCVNLQSDANNCGSCGNVCNPGVGCNGGLCHCPGPQYWTNVDNRCTLT
jgi:hypothetical protein